METQGAGQGLQHPEPGSPWCSLLGFTAPGTPRVAQLEVQHKAGLSSYSLVITYSFFSNVILFPSEKFREEAIFVYFCLSSAAALAPPAHLGGQQQHKCLYSPVPVSFLQGTVASAPFTNIQVSAQEPPTSFDTCNVENSTP